MSWISKSLTLDLLAITIDGLTKVFERITAEPDTPTDQSPWSEQPTTPAPAPVNVELPADTPVPSSTVRQAAQEAHATVEQASPQPAQTPQQQDQRKLDDAQQAAVAAAQATPAQQTQPTAAPAEEPNQLVPEGHPLTVDTQENLRAIAKKEGAEWIKELFKSYGGPTATGLFTIPFSQLPALNADTQQRMTHLGITK